jgi:hypothetical protein
MKETSQPDDWCKEITDFEGTNLSFIAQNVGVSKITPSKTVSCGGVLPQLKRKSIYGFSHKCFGQSVEPVP